MKQSKSAKQEADSEPVHVEHQKVSPLEKKTPQLVWYWREEQGQQDKKLKAYPAIVMGPAAPGNYQKHDMALTIKVFSLPSEIVRDACLHSPTPQSGRWTFEK